MTNYNPPPEWIEAEKRANEERKKVCDRLSEKWRVKEEKQKQEAQKGKKK